MDLERINNTYGKMIWSIAGRYSTGVWDQMDVYNELLLQVLIGMERGQIPPDGSEESKSKVAQFVICRSIDIVRNEYRRKGMWSLYTSRKLIEEFDENSVEARSSEYDYEMEKRFIWEMLQTLLPIKSAIFVYELTFPRQKTIEIAMRDKINAENDPKLRMNSANLKILPRHVAEALGPDFKLSKATMSRIKQQARTVIEKALDLEMEIKKCYVSGE